jgi:hypothetical protein
MYNWAAFALGVIWIWEALTNRFRFRFYSSSVLETITVATIDHRNAPSINS